MSSDLISLNEAAELIGKNLRTIQRHIKNGKLTRHQKDDKSFVSRREIESKFNIIATKPRESVVSERTEDATTTRQGQPVEDYQKKWVEEIQNHAETREELGVWKGRAEAYQAFASRLLGNGNIDSIEKEVATSEVKKAPVDPSTTLGVNKSIKTYTYLIYGLIGIFFIIILFFVLIVLKVI